MSMATTSDVITAAMSIASDTADGKLSPTDLESQAVAEMRSLVGEVVGPDDPAWQLQCAIARGVLAADGIPVDELSEWAAVARQRAGEPVSTPDPDGTTPEPISTASDEPSAPEEATGADDTTESEPPVLTVVPDPAPASPAPSAGADYNPLRGWTP
ncbi:flagellar hook-length control protein [Mycolicibacterium sp. CR10]|uniref:flagellar hook-length control protein n=1 Tax=Mycolicibacterium sp. CR10 TaxID=2562314 RepID=UPI0010C13D28|nr:flagellar hook-length control protein [Mycolicibacterium sp. CR10]